MPANSNLKNKLLLIPYILLLLLGAWYRYSAPNAAFWDGDSDTYLNPALLKMMTGKWFMDERPLPYLQFVYIFFSRQQGLDYVIAAQKALDIAGAFFLIVAWLGFLKSLGAVPAVLHLLGYVMIGIYVSSPALMYYEHLIGPESTGMFLICALIACMSIGFSGAASLRARVLFLMLAIFVNLFIGHPMPKLIFICIFLEAVIIAVLLGIKTISLKTRWLAILFPHLLYVFVVALPEYLHQTERPFQSRVYIEYQQMVFTHFNLLVRNKTDLGLSSALEDSLVQYFHESERGYEPTLTGFSNDYLMFGRAASTIDSFYNYNYAAIANYYKQLNFILATKYTLPLAQQICRQVGAFYVPNRTIAKDMFLYQADYQAMKDEVLHTDEHFTESLGFINGQRPDNELLLQGYYQKYLSRANALQFERLPLIFGNNFFVYRWFDAIYLSAMLIFLTVAVLQHRLFKLNIVTLLYAVTFIYVFTIAVVHTFDVLRFIQTIYPILLITTFMATAYVLQVIALKIHLPGRV